MRIFRYRRPLAENHAWRDQSKEADQEGTRNHRRLETIPVVDEYQTAGEAESRLRVGGGAVGSEWTAEAGRVFGRDWDGGGGVLGRHFPDDSVKLEPQQWATSCQSYCCSLD